MYVNTDTADYSPPVEKLEKLSKTARRLYENIIVPGRFYPADGPPGLATQELLDAELITIETRVHRARPCYVPVGTTPMIREAFPDEDQPFLVAFNSDEYSALKRSLVTLLCSDIIELVRYSEEIDRPESLGYTFRLRGMEPYFGESVSFLGFKKLEVLAQYYHINRQLGPIAFAAKLLGRKPPKVVASAIEGIGLGEHLQNLEDNDADITPELSRRRQFTRDAIKATALAVLIGIVALAYFASINSEYLSNLR